MIGTSSNNSQQGIGEKAREASKRLFYVAYFRLHEIEWDIPEPINIQDGDRMMQVKVSHGPFRVPLAAMQQPKTKAGGASFEIPDEVVDLPDGLYCEIAFNVTDHGPDSNADWTAWWDEYTTIAEELASSTSLSMKQRVAPVKVGEYIRVEEPDKVYGQQYRFRAFAGAPATVNEDMKEDVRCSVEAVMTRRLHPRIYLALNWYNHSKRVDNGSDRLIALWFATEVLVAAETGTDKTDTKLARILARPEYGLNVTPEEINSNLGLIEMRRLRNQIAHEGYRPSSWDLAASRGRDLPQILDDSVAEILRHEMGLSPTETLIRHIHK